MIIETMLVQPLPVIASEVDHIAPVELSLDILAMVGGGADGANFL